MQASAQNWSGIAHNTEPDNVIATFYPRPVQNKRESEKQGRPVFDEIDYVKILIPGDTKNVIDRAAKEEDRTRWPAAWDRYVEKREGEIDGTPIKAWGYLTTAQVATLESLHILSVEALAHLPDRSLPKLGPGARELQKRAQQFLAGDDETIQELRAENQELRDCLKQLEARVEQLSKAKKPGRPKKKS